jgi:hypothetical protein
MAGEPKDRIRSTIDMRLFNAASAIPLHPPPDRAMFYAEGQGANLAASFVGRHPDYVRLDDLLNLTPQGRSLWDELKVFRGEWSKIEKVWWQLSWKLARSAIGVVNIFGPPRFVEDRPLSEFKHKYSTGHYANTVLEIVELPELEANPRVTEIYFNEQKTDW